MQDVFSKSQNSAVVHAVQSIATAAMCEPVFAAQASETARRGGPSAYLEETGFVSLLDGAAFPPIYDEHRRLHVARLSTSLLTAIIDVGIN